MIPQAQMQLQEQLQGENEEKPFCNDENESYF